MKRTHSLNLESEVVRYLHRKEVNISKLVRTYLRKVKDKIEKEGTENWMHSKSKDIEV